MNKTLFRHWQENRRFVLFLFLMVVFRSSLADWNTVPTGSMKPTILEGDRIWVDKLAYDVRLPLSSISVKHIADPQRGDIVIFRSKFADKRLVKRVLGLPGETISMQSNVLSINGNELTYLLEEETAELSTAREQYTNLNHLIRIDHRRNSQLANIEPIVVPAGHYLVLGDNRNNSADSRVIGFVPRHEIIGKTTKVVMSLDYDNDYLPRKGRFLKKL